MMSIPFFLNSNNIFYKKVLFFLHFAIDLYKIVCYKYSYRKRKTKEKDKENEKLSNQ